MKILVTFALKAEFAAWQRRRNFRQLAERPYPLYAADMGGNSVRVLLTGIGSDCAVEGVRWVLSSGTDLCISSGFAGALKADMPVGELLAGRVVCRAEKQLAVASDRDLFAAACDAGARRVERMLTSRRLVMDVAEKAALSREADVVEMESFAILAEAARCGVRAVAVRAVSDTADASLPYDFGSMCDDRGRLRLQSLLLEIACQPRRLPALLRLTRDCRVAARQLAEFFEEYLDLLDVRLHPWRAEMVAVR
jgi:adenosylhomocysteine nucleosidase